MKAATFAALPETAEVRLMDYFAYGSNMDWAQMQERCPSARFRSRAMLPGFKLAFTRRSISRGCGVADIVPDSSGRVWGVLYELADCDLPVLDSCEGFVRGRARNAYLRSECAVLLEGNPHKCLAAWTYVAERQPSPPPPNRAYIAHLISGAQHWRLPTEYIDELENVETMD